VAGMMPYALAVGAGGEFRSPMALAVIGGLLFSTVLSLVFVPAMFLVMDDIGTFSWRIGRRMLSSTGGEHPKSAQLPDQPSSGIVHSSAAE
jgi:AcrB/AcrD/AcrF family protein